MHTFPAPAQNIVDFDEHAIIRQGEPPFCHYPQGRDDRQDQLEAIRYTVLTMKDLVEAIQNQWPHDRPQPPDLQSKLHFAVFAIARVRNGDLRRMAEHAQP